VAATNQNLEQAVAAGHFREDLFYRLHVVRIVTPPLRERPEEIPLLAGYFVERYAKAFKREGFTLPPETMERLIRHSFPGNVRELENTIKRMIVLGDPGLTVGPVLDGPAKGQERRAANMATPGQASLKDISKRAAQAAERDAILKALEETRWNRLRAAKLLNMSYRSLLYKIKDAGLDRKRRATDNL
jgi:two-component system response regulator AtoC